MAFNGSMVGNGDQPDGFGGGGSAAGKSSSTSPAGKKLFTKKLPGAPGKLGKGGASTRSESLSKLRGKGALA